MKILIFTSLNKAINNQIHGEVKFGSYLSGGIDSSVLAYFLSKNRKIDTFSIEFENPEYDESNAQKILVDRLNVNHHSLRIKNSDILKIFRMQ